MVVGVAGVPGSGKTTTAEEVVSRIHERLRLQPHTSPAIAVSMDGASSPGCTIVTSMPPRYHTGHQYYTLGRYTGTIEIVVTSDRRVSRD